jgi:excisionase family DNA binding protein
MNTDEITAVAEKVASIVLRELNEKHINKQHQLESPLLSAQETATYLGLSVSTVYKYSHGRVIPFYKPNGRDIYFKKSDLDSFLESKRYSSQDEIEAFADDYLVNK